MVQRQDLVKVERVYLRPTSGMCRATVKLLPDLQGYIREHERHIWLIAIYGKNVTENMKSSTLEAVRKKIDDEYKKSGNLGKRTRS
jgi:hypothetical protein